MAFNLRDTQEDTHKLLHKIGSGVFVLIATRYIPGVSLLKIQVPNVSRAAQPNGALPLTEVWMECLRFLQI